MSEFDKQIHKKSNSDKRVFEDYGTEEISILKILLVRVFGKYVCQVHDGKAYKYKGVIYVI